MNLLYHHPVLQALSVCISREILHHEGIINSSVQGRILLHTYKTTNIILERSISTAYFINVNSNNNNDELIKGLTMETNSE